MSSSLSSSSSSPPLFPPPPPPPPPFSSSGAATETTTTTETKPETTTTSSKSSKVVIPEPLTTLLPPPDSYRLDQIKNGALVESLEILSRNRLIIGRAPDCDVTLEHASVSRYHAALLWAPKNDHQYRQGENRQSFWYLVDCGSTHGTTCNKHRIDAGKMIKLSANNNVFRFGASSRIFTLTSSSQIDDEEEINDQPKIEMPSKQKVHSNKSNYNDDDDDNQDGCSWGMGLTDCTDDAEETADAAALRRIIGAMKNGGEKGSPNGESGNRNAYADNAYKCLQQWFEREGQGSDFASYRVEQQNSSASNGKFRCTFELPIDGQWIPIEGEYATRKKDAIADACMKCCEILDQAQLLFPWQKQNAAKKSRKAAYGDDDDDDDDYYGDMIDETLSAARKRRKRYEKETADHGENRSIETYETLNEKWKTLNAELRAAKIKLATIDLPETESGGSIASSEDDPLDAYMSAMQGRKRFGLTLNEKIEKSNLRCRIKELEAEQAKVEQLIELAKPVVVEIAPSAAILEQSSSSSTKSTTESNTNGERKNDDAKKETEEKDIENIDREVSTTNDDDNNEQSSIDENQSRSAQTKKTANIKEIEMSKPIAPQQQSKSSSSSSSCSPTRSENLSKGEKTKMARKLKQGSIVEAIEKEKRLEARQQVRAAEIADENDPDYVGWTPPIGQSGDGRTHLNDKFGY